MKYFKVLFLLIVTFNLYGQKKILPQHIKEDLKVLKEIAINNSPFLSTTEKEKVALYMDSITKQVIKSDFTQLEFAKYFGQINKYLKLDGHLHIELDTLAADIKLFPIPVAIIDQHVIVNTKQAAIPFGSIILNINNIRTKDILNAGDSIDDKSPRMYVHEYFPVIYYMNFGEYNKFVVRYKQSPEDSAVYEQTLEHVLAKSYDSILSLAEPIKAEENKESQLITTFVTPGDYAIVRLNSFVTDLDFWPSRMETLLENIKNYGVKHLVLDLRNNGGGEAVVPGILLSYLTKETFEDGFKMKLPNKEAIVLKNLYKIQNAPVHSDSIAAEYLTQLYSQTQQHDNFSYKVTTKKMNPQPATFDGKLYVLVGSKTNSAAAYFASMLKALNRGMIIGDTPAGSIYNVTAGYMLTYLLPYSKIKFTIPIGSIEYSEWLYQKQPTRYLLPDKTIPFEVKYAYYLKSQDPEIEEVLKIIKSN